MYSGERCVDYVKADPPLLASFWASLPSKCYPTLRTCLHPLACSLTPPYVCMPSARVMQRCSIGAPANPSPYRGRNSARGMAIVNSNAFFALLWEG